jgi:hypothetical protein
VARHTSNGWQDLRSEGLLELKKTEFQEFCVAVVKYEAYDRHDDPLVGAGEDGPDGGRDLLVTIAKAPQTTKRDYQRLHHLAPLTEDPVVGLPRTRTAYSCKSGKNWLKLALDDAQKRGERAIEVLAEGGYFKLLINRPGKLDHKYIRDGKQLTPHEHLRVVLWDRLKERNADTADPGPRIQIVDADAIATYLRARQPEGGDVDRWAERLDLVLELKSLDEWRRVHVADRQQPEFEEDDERAAVRREALILLASGSLHSEDRVACIVGKPGVGKTRLVIEALSSDAALAQRVRVALSPEEARDAIDARRLLRKHRDIILVIDDCFVNEVHDVASRFRAAAAAAQEGSRARMVLLVPASFDAVRADLPGIKVWSLTPLDSEHVRAVVEGEIGRNKNDADVVAIARFSEGFPWFACLLAIEFNEAGRAPTSMREAALFAIASRREASSPHDLEALRLRRARSLLVVSLTSAVDWDALGLDTQERLARAVGLSRWQDVVDAAVECERRGILRRSLGWQLKYVTPQVLEREIIAWLLGPGGPDPGGRTLSRFAEDYLEELFLTLARVGLPADVVAGIADVALLDLVEAAADLSSLRVVGLLGARLWFVARHRPAETARELVRRIESTGLDELRAKLAVRRGLVWALEVLSGRAESFEDAEAALFRLACAENEALGNNATRIWAGLFFVDIGAIHRSLARRIGSLEQHLLDEDAVARLVALKGVEAVITMYPTRMASDPGEGPWLRPTSDEAREGRLRAWNLLAGRFADSDAAVAGAAKKLAIEQLRSAIHFGVGAEVMLLLAGRAEGFSRDERVRLREKLEEVRAYDLAYLDAELEQLQQLEGAIAPASFGERLRQRVGVWGPAALRGDDAHIDDALVEEGLQGDAPLRAELEWLLTDHAQRSHILAYAMGRCDSEGILLEDLRRLAKVNPGSWKAQALVARYIGGMAQAGRRERAEALMRQLRLDPDEATQAALALVELGPGQDLEHLRWLQGAIRRGAIASFAIAELGRRRTWLAGVGDEAFVGFVSALVDAGAEGDTTECVTAALGFLVDRYEQSTPPAAVYELLDRILERLAPISVNGMADHHWELAAKFLVSAGQATRVAELAVVALSRSAGSNDFAWASLHRAAESDPSGAFGAVARGLDARGPGDHLLVAFWYHRQPFAWPTAEVLAWVGDDERRARAAAGLVRVHGDELPEPLRALIRRFGAHGSVAREIMARIESTDGIVPSLADHDLKQLTRARLWLRDPDASVATFAKTLVDELERSHERHAAYEENQRRRFGT